MPNLFTEIISKTGSAYVQSISGVSAVTEIVSDAKSVRDSIMKVPDNAKGVYRGIRQGGFKKITDWFLERGDEFGMNSTLDESGDDFDAGFKYGSDDSGESSKVLDADGMKDIARGQVSAMYNIAGKQAEATAMSASEVISSMNNRSSEILSSLGNINSSLTTISEKLESIISLQKSAQEGNQNGANGFYDENGNLTYRSVFAGGKNYLMNMLPVTDLQSLKQLGTISSVVSMLASKINEKQFSFLGDRSINEVSEDFSERLLNVQNKAFTKLFSTDFFQTIFGNQLLTGGKKDYSSYIESDYTKDKAVFDGMTRKSIVDIIPGYLKKITEAVTGQTWHVNQYGNLSQTRDVDDFKQVLSASIKDGFSDRALNSIIKAGADQSIPAEDIRRAQRCLMSMYTGYAMTELQTRLSSDLFENGGDPRVNRETAQILAQSSGKSLEHWVAVIALIDSNLQNDSNMRESFIRAVNANMVAMDKQAQEYAMNHPNADNVGEFEFEDFKKTIAEHLKFLNESNIEEDLTYQEMIDRNIITKEQLPTGAKLDERRSEYELRKREIDKMKQSEVVANIGVSFKQFRETTLDYLYSIFDILNRGINVHNTGKKPFPKMDIKKAKFDVPSATNNITSTGDGDSGNRASTASRSTDDTGSDTGTDAQSTDGESTDGESTEGTGTTSVVNTEEQQQSSQSTTEVKPATPGQNLANATRDLVETVTNPIKNEWGYLKEDFTDFTDSFTEAGRKRQAERAGRTARQQKADWAEESKLRRDVADMNTDSESAEKDKATCDRVFSLLQTTATNGGDLAKAQSDINSEINQIEDAQLRSRMQTMVNKSFQRMNRETGSPAKSKIGKVLLWGFGLIKSFVKPILSAAKTFLGKFGKGLVAPLIKLMAKGVAGGTKKIVSGAKAVKEAIGTRARYVKAGEGEQHDIWGYATTTEVLRNEDGSFQLDKNGNIKTKTRRIKEDEGSGLLQLLSPILQMRKDLIKLPFKLTGVILKGTGKLIKGLSKRVKIIGANVKLGFSIVSEKIGNKFKGWFGDLGEKLSDTWVGKFGKALTDNSFAKGWKDAWKKEEEAKAERNAKAQSVSDFATRSTADILKSEDGTLDGKKTVMTRILESLTSVVTSVNDYLKPAESSETSSTTNEQGSTEEGTQSGTTEQTNETQTNDFRSTEIGQWQTSNNVQDTASNLANFGSASGGTTEQPGTTEDVSAATGSVNPTEGMTGGQKALFNIGKLLGGMSKIMVGIGQAVLSVVAGMSGFKALMNIGMQILKRSLAPINKVLTSLYRTLKPIVKTITKLLRKIVNYVVEMAMSIVKAMQPILEAIEPIITEMLDALMPVLEQLTDVIDVLIVPLVSVLKIVVVPILQTIANTLEMLLGIVQMGFGFVLFAIGGIASIIGYLCKAFGIESVFDTGLQMIDMGKSMMVSGGKQLWSGLTKQGETWYDMTHDLFTQQEEDTQQQETTTTTPREVDTTIHGSALEGTYGGAGADQHRYGGYLNMANRGCGPVALADAYSRRTGNGLDPKSLASAMHASGNYSTNRGTSVSSYINSSRALGMNLVPGGVTARSLRYATPNNPITIVGSGSDFSTRNGNNHYMNVVGSDGHGIAYVSNPMSGRIERKSIHSLASRSVLGLYGSGDADVYSFSDAVQESLEELKNIASSLISIFTGDSSVEAALAAEDEKTRYNQLQVDTANLSDEEKAAIDKRARELFEKDHARLEGETDAEYDARYEKVKQKYWSMAASEKLTEKVKASAGGTDEGAYALVKNATSENGWADQLTDQLTAIDDSVEAGSIIKVLESSSDREKKSSGKPRYESPHGALLWTDAYEPQIRENNGKGWSRSASNDDYQSILAEFFQNTISPNIKLTGVYEKYLDPASYDFVGSRGETHAGADFTIGGNPQVRATTSGQVIEVGDNETYGKFVKIRDIGNDVHIYGHLKDVRVTKGQTVEGGAILGTIGHTGADTTILVDNEKPLVQSGDRLHYEIRDEDNVAYNPFTFFSYKQGGGRNGMVTLSGEDAMYHAAAEVFQKAAEYSSEPGVLKHNITSSKNVTFDGGFVIDDIPSHCTGMMGAVVKRMGYYTYPGSGYTNTNQGEGYMGGDVADKWGVGTGTAKIYNKDGSLSQDWETGSGSSTYGDITFNSTGNAHAHMPVFADTNGRVLGFNGGADDSFRNSLKLADYILRNGAPPTDVTYHETGERDRNGHMASDQIGAIANPMQYYVRYVGPPVTFYSDYYDSTDYFDENEIDTIEDQAAQDAAESYIESQDTSSGAPSKWKYTGDVTGTVYNKAGEKLCRFCLYDPEASYQNCKYYYDKWIKDDVVYFYSGYLPIKDSGNKKLQTVFVSQFEETAAGKAAKTWFKENGIADPFKPSEVVYKPSDSENFETILTNLGIEKTHYYGNGVDKKLYLGWKDPLRFVNDFGTSREGFNNMISTYRDKYEYSDVAKINEPEPTENNYRYGNDPLWSLYVDAPRSERDKIESKINANKWAYAKNISKDAAKALKYNYSQKKNLGLTKEYLAKEKGFDIDLDDRWKKHTSEMTPNYQYGLVSKDKYKKVDPYGSGDASTIIPDIQPITSDTLLDSIVSQDQSPVIVNQYSTQSTDDHVLNSILTNTYNVRSEKIESTLEEMLQLMKEKNQRKRNQSSLLSTPSQPQSTSDSDFSNDIPSAIQRIAIG